MSDYLFELLRGYFHDYGYWTVAVALLLENAGIPVPGETILLFASFLAFSEHSLSLHYIIMVGTLAATIGDNLGYAIGRRGGRPFLQRYQHFFRIRQRHFDRGERLFIKHGAHTVFVARFIAGLRIIAGPLAGVLRMPWKRFVLFNFLGALTWVTAISVLGYIFGSQWERVLHILKRVNLILLLAALVIAGLLWWRRRAGSGRPVH